MSILFLLLYNKLKTTVREHSMGKTAVPFIDFIATQTNRKCNLYHTGELNHTGLNRMEYFSLHLSCKWQIGLQ